MLMRLSARVAVLVLALIAAPSASALTPGAYQAMYDANGDPYVFAGEPVASQAQWQICRPDCGPVVATGPELRPGPQPAGTTFKATDPADGSTLTTELWRGPLSMSTSPTVTGELRPGRVITAVPGAWSGGWEQTGGPTKLYACPATVVDAQCVTMAPMSAALVVGPKYAGWYVGAYTVAVGSKVPTLAIWIPPPPPYERSTAPGPTPGGPIPGTIGPLRGPIAPNAVSKPPTLTGKVASGRRVTVEPGTWPDAPDGGKLASAVQACPTDKENDDCRLISDWSTTDRTVTVPDDKLGWYLGAVISREWPSTMYSSPLIPAAVGVGKAGAKVPAADLRFAHGPLSSKPVRLGFTPKLRLFKRARWQGRYVSVGRIRCAKRCEATLTVRAGKRKVTRTLVVSRKQRALRLRLSRRSVGSATLRVSVDVADSAARKRGRVSPR